MTNLTVMRVLIALCMCGCVLSAYPLLIALGQYSVVIDAVQSEQIRQLDIRLTTAERKVEETDGNMKWILGSVAGIYGLLSIIGIFNFKLMAKK